MLVPVCSAYDINDPGDLETFVDGFMYGQMMAYHIDGATVSIVKGGKTVFAKGYGYADRNSWTPVSADMTMFGVGSISKTFAWTAVMQLQGQGKIDLDADINQYLDFKIPDTYPGHPITMRNLLTHTPGFEEMSAAEATQAEAFGKQNLIDTMPERVFPPGKYASYSNYGAELAGYIVQRVSGMPFNDYVKKNIFAPLNMTMSDFEDPLPASEKKYETQTFYFKDGVFVPGADQPLKAVAPAGSMKSTATDMANFMIAQLQDGRFGDGRIMSEKSAVLLHTQHFTYDSRLPGMCYGFYEGEMNGIRYYQHGGDTTTYHAEMALFPEQQLGIYISTNTDAAHSSPIRDLLVKSVLDRYYPVAPGNPDPMEGYKERASRFTGSYVSTRSVFTGPAKYVTMMTPSFSISSEANGTALLKSGSGAVAGKYVEIQPGLLQQIDGINRLGFVEENGQPVFFAMSAFPVFAFMKQAFYETPGFNRGLLSVLGAVFMLCLFYVVISLLRRNPSKRSPSIPLMAVIPMLALSIAGIASVWGAYVFPADTANEHAVNAFHFGLLISGLLSAVMLVVCAVLWGDEGQGILAKAAALAITLAGVVLTIWGWYWNLIYL